MRGRCSQIVTLVSNIKEGLYAQLGNFILWIPVFQASGIILYFSLESEPSVIYIMALAAAGVTLLFFMAGRLYLVLLLFTILGFMCAYVKARICLPKNFAITQKTYVKEKIGTLRKVDFRPQYVQLLLCDVEGRKRAKTCVRLSVRTAVDAAIRAGDTVKFSGVIYPPRATMYGYDFARDAYFKGIGAVGFATSEVVLHKSSGKVKFLPLVERVRLKIYEKFLSGLGRDSAEILSALIIGKRLGIREEILVNVRKAGLAHLLAISGLHLSFVVGAVFLFFRCVFACSVSLSLNYNMKKPCAVLAAMSGLLYLFIAGMPVSACRAFIMVAMTFFGFIIDRQHNGQRSVAASASVMLFQSPEAILSPSFQMSFAAVTALVSVPRLFKAIVGASGVLRYFVATCTSSLIASVATAPYVIYHFHYFSIAGVLANIVAIPLTTFFIIPIGIIYLCFCGTAYSTGIAYCLDCVIYFLLCIAKYTAHLKWVPVLALSITSCTVLSATAGLLVVFFCNGVFRIVGAMAFLFFAILCAYAHRSPDIIFDSSAVVVKERDSNLYFALRGRSKRSSRYVRWAENNTQDRILTYSDKALDNKLVCYKGGCIYDGRVLIAQTEDFLLQRCDGVDLAIYYGVSTRFEECKSVQYIDQRDILNDGVHFVWIGVSQIKVNKTRTNRLWHTNQARVKNPGFPKGSGHVLRQPWV